MHKNVFLCFAVFLCLTEAWYADEASLGEVPQGPKLSGVGFILLKEAHLTTYSQNAGYATGDHFRLRCML